ncbi:hypothetical protein TIFTF001_037382 [Ficus carica]|uniref:Uncharacterized protein n=1 Tax=Ficus carica TaxID=3494 RepID=A0AA88E6Y3_FICCA|nr:hypothetical protein TIFTF001_037382 [Ficus carica]
MDLKLLETRSWDEKLSSLQTLAVIGSYHLHDIYMLSLVKMFSLSATYLICSTGRMIAVRESQTADFCMVGQRWFHNLYANVEKTCNLRVLRSVLYAFMVWE